MALVLLAGLTGCASLPDVGPFVEASSQLRSAVAASGATVEAELRLITNATAADQLKKNWEERDRAFAAIASYAGSLEAIVDAGNEGAASAEKVADSVAGLANAAGIALPGSPEAVAVGTDIAKFISAQIARARAAKSLQKAMEQAQPAIVAIAHHIAADLSDLEDMFLAAATQADNNVRTGAEFSALIGYRNSLLKQIGTKDPADTATLGQQAQLAQLLQATEEGYAKYLARRKEIQDRLRAGRVLIHTARLSANDWAVAHGNLITALRERRPINTASLIQAAVEIRDLIRKVREL